MKRYSLDSFKGGENTIRFEATLGGEKPVGLLNVDFEDGLIKKRLGWHNFKGMVKVLSDLNKKYKKLGIVGDFTVRLPIKGKIDL